MADDTRRDDLPASTSPETGVHAAQRRLARLELLEQVDQLLTLLAINHA